MTIPAFGYALTTAFLSIPLLILIAWAAGRRRFADASRTAVLTWCRVIGGEDPAPVSQRKRKAR